MVHGGLRAALADPAGAPGSRWGQAVARCSAAAGRGPALQRLAPPRFATCNSLTPYAGATDLAAREPQRAQALATLMRGARVDSPVFRFSQTGYLQKK